MPTCPQGHESSDPALCDVCGWAMAGQPLRSPPVSVPAATSLPWAAASPDNVPPAAALPPRPPVNGFPPGGIPPSTGPSPHAPLPGAAKDLPPLPGEHTGADVPARDSITGPPTPPHLGPVNLGLGTLGQGGPPGPPQDFPPHQSYPPPQDFPPPRDFVPQHQDFPPHDFPPPRDFAPPHDFAPRQDFPPPATLDFPPPIGPSSPYPPPGGAPPWGATGMPGLIATGNGYPPVGPPGPEWECPECHTVQVGRYCELDGYDSLTAAAPPMAPPAEYESPATTYLSPGDFPPPGPSQPWPQPAYQHPIGPGGDPLPGWSAVVTADRDHYDAVLRAAGPAAARIQFPQFCPERRFLLHGPQLLIGRRSVSRGIEPEIDLTGPPEDPAVGHAHALLVAQQDGRWAVIDLRSTNGVYLNGATDPIEPDVPVPLENGDRIHVGAWTTLTLHAG
jgi:hypothetical protein